MATSDFLPFATNFAANVETQANWITNAAAVNGFAAGVARSRECNKAWRQPSFMAAAWGRLTADTLDEDCLDDGNVPRLVDQLSRMVGAIASDRAEVKEAPADGFLYGRRVVGGVGQWALVPGEALQDNNTYGRRNGAWVQVPQLSDLNRYLLLAGGTMTGPNFLTLHANPTQPMHAATRGWVLTEIAGSMGTSGFVPEAPPTGGPFARQGGNWVLISLTGNYLPLTGGHIRRTDGGGDPLSLSAPHGQYARIWYTVDAMRTWSAGTGHDGSWMVADESIGVVRQRQDGSGFFDLTSDGGTSLRLSSRAYNLDNYINILGGNTNWLIGPQGGQGRLIFYNGNYALTINNNGTIQAGWDIITPSAVYAPTVYIGGIALYNHAGYLHTPSSFWAGDLRSSANVYAPNGWVDAGGNVTGWDVYARNWVNGGYIYSRGNAAVNGTLRAGVDIVAEWGRVHGLDVTAQRLLYSYWDCNIDHNLDVHNATNLGQLRVYWNAYIDGISFASVHTDTSDRALKEDLAPYHCGLAAVLQFNPQSWLWCKDEGTGRRYYGLVADDVAEVAPEMVFDTEPEAPGKGISLMPLICALVNATKELASKVEALEKERS